VGESDLVLYNRMTYARVNFFMDCRMHCPELLCCILHALDRNMRVRIARSDKYRSALEVALIVRHIQFVADQPAGEGCYAAPFFRMARYKFKRETGALRESGKEYIFRCYAIFIHVSNNIL